MLSAKYADMHAVTASTGSTIIYLTFAIINQHISTGVPIKATNG